MIRVLVVDDAAVMRAFLSRVIGSQPDMELLGAGTKTLFGRVIAEPLRALACVAIACWISWQLTLMFLVLVPAAARALTKDLTVAA